MREKIKTCIISLALIITVAGCSKGPAPYTPEAMHNLKKAAQYIDQPVPKPGMTQEDGVKLIYETYTRLYDEAGYSLDKSILQLEDDYRKDPEYAAPALSQTMTLLVVGQLTEIKREFDNKKMDIGKAIPAEVINAINNISHILEERKRK